MGLLGNAQILSLDKMVLDNHLARQLDIMVRPVLVDMEHLQVDLIERVGIGGHYLGQPETRAYVRREYVPVWPPVDRSMLDVAHEEALDILYNYQTPPLPAGAADRIEDIVAQADEALD
jgi:trimethylamine--corrinoid protein Co-methyltransferase